MINDSSSTNTFYSCSKQIFDRPTEDFNSFVYFIFVNLRLRTWIITHNEHMCIWFRCESISEFVQQRNNHWIFWTEYLPGSEGNYQTLLKYCLAVCTLIAEKVRYNNHSDDMLKTSFRHFVVVFCELFKMHKREKMNKSFSWKVRERVVSYTFTSEI